MVAVYRLIGVGAAGFDVVLESGDGASAVVGKDFFGRAFLVGGIAGEAALFADFGGAIDKDFVGGEVAEFRVGEGEVAFDDAGFRGCVDFFERFGKVYGLGVVAVEKGFAVYFDHRGVGVIAAEEAVEVNEGDLEMFG